jgi:hypothetical protein
LLTMSQVDEVAQYIDWAMANEFGVMDINVPALVTTEDVADPSLWQAGVTEKTFEGRVTELVTYIWDNFIQLLDADDDIFIMGVGNAYVGIKALLTTRGMLIYNPGATSSHGRPNIFAIKTAKQGFEALSVS